jgi:hypothetical protein
VNPFLHKINHYVEKASRANNQLLGITARRDFRKQPSKGGDTFELSHHPDTFEH